MNIISTIPALRFQLAQWREAKQTIAFVPTMGNLHAGHIQLAKKACEIADRVVVSIFVNPLQFGVGEDYQTYPRTLEADCEKLARTCVDSVFTPTEAEMYPNSMQKTTTIVEVPHLSHVLCGAFRPGHFVGMATVVNKLFNSVQPDKALFGEKDYQQLLVVKQMVADLLMPIEIVSVPTVREADGLAMSSRNGYLTPEQRAQAPRLWQMLNAVREKILHGERNFTHLENQARSELKEAGFDPDYVAIRRAQTLTAPTPDDRELVILTAAHLGKTRLIDNIVFKLD